MDEKNRYPTEACGFEIKVGNMEILVCFTGEAVIVEDEVVVTNSIVLPNKTLNLSVLEEIIL